MWAGILSRVGRSPSAFAEGARWAAFSVGGLAIAATLLSFRRSPHWMFRIWDFPRLQIAGCAVAAGALLSASIRPARRDDQVFFGALGAVLLVQARKIFVYTPVWPVQVERTRRAPADGDRFRMIVVNVLQDNSSYERVLDIVRAHDPDVVLAVEVDSRWERALEPLVAEYPHVVRQPQDNYYGMSLYSRLPLEDPQIAFLVQDDVPSVHVALVLPGGERVRLHGLHPRPPEPLRNQDSAPRDAELVMVGGAIGRVSEDRPTVVAGDLNDVAWSHTTTLFLRLSGLLDPRIGRGFYNSYSARNPLLRWPLDHVFHSDHFRLVQLRRLADVGSDHFPILVELSYEPGAARGQEEPQPRTDDAEEARSKLRAADATAADG